MKINWANIIVVAITWALGIAILVVLLNSCSIELHFTKKQKHVDITKHKGKISINKT